MIGYPMLKKLKIAKDFTDKDAFMAIHNYLRENNNPKDIKELFDWYKDSGLSDNDDKRTVFRGLKFSYDYAVKSVIFDRKIPIEDDGFESWSTDVYSASNFFYGKEVGMVISNEVDKRKYMDVNKIISYLNSKNYSVDLGYQDECEILSPFCNICTIDDLEVMYIKGNHYDKFLNDVRKGGWELDDKRTGDSYYRFCVFDRNRITIFSDFKHTLNNFKRKQEDDCHFIGDFDWDHVR